MPCYLPPASRITPRFEATLRYIVTTILKCSRCFHLGDLASSLPAQAVSERECHGRFLRTNGPYTLLTSFTPLQLDVVLFPSILGVMSEKQGKSIRVDQP